MKSKTSAIAIFLIIAYAAIFILQLWFGLFSSESFFKITITLGVVFVAMIAVILVKTHLFQEDELKRDKFVD